MILLSSIVLIVLLIDWVRAGPSPLPGFCFVAFKTSTTITGNFGGLHEADKFCIFLIVFQVVFSIAV
jgi:hypothetical protein